MARQVPASADGLSTLGMVHLVGIIEGRLQVTSAVSVYDWNQSVQSAREYDHIREGRAIKCPVCSMVSYNPNDIEQGYCGNCHDWTSEGKVTPIKAAKCCPGGPINGHRAWCTSDEARALREAGANTPRSDQGS